MGCVIFPLDSHSKIAGSRAHSFQINQSIEQTVFSATCFQNFHAEVCWFPNPRLSVREEISTTERMHLWKL